MMKRWIVAFGLAAASSFPCAALASEWGCKILLCASSSDPSWRGVPACHAPMYKLISAMKQPGFSWPTCPEAGTGRPGHEQFEDCPSGWVATTSPNSDRRSSRKSHCAREINLCGEGRRARSGRDGESCTRTEVVARGLRQDPYYFDINDDTDGSVSRHWFSLTK
ncbi:hypothetical protein HNQ96_005056 [Aminobacter lissarensis]|uniref:Uncharacterized protein n=1 Tax=Aminobacter carboxidus TaxID=376165 RepID=A0A8E1WL81_9HYPH|nr:hypothetical protein [Aminobacter lissarensis]MBB6469167.1 hypothetical protein [Aminobacter lissarensis]